MFKMTRAFYLPENAVEQDSGGTDAAVYYYDNAAGRPCAIGFHGRAQKPDFHYQFMNKNARAEHVADFIKQRREYQEWKKARRAEKTKPHTLQVGHVLYTTWGYEQTNVDFYQVTKIIGKCTVEVREIASRMVQDTGYMTGKVIPELDHFTGEPMRKRAGSDNRIKISSYAHARLWDGKPVNFTAYY